MKPLLLMVLTAATFGFCIVLSLQNFQAGQFLMASLMAMAAGVNVAAFVANAIVAARA